MFTEAHAEDPSIAMKILFWARDIRWGAWERRFFRTIFNYLKQRWLSDKYLEFIPEYWRWDDIWINDLLREEELKAVSKWLKEWNWLLAKWLPRKWAIAKQVVKKLWLTAKEYRKLIVWLTNVVETKMCKKEWKSIEYNKIPWQALNKYRQAWYRNDQSRFETYLESVNKWEVKMNWSTLYPYQVMLNIGNRELVNAQWSSLKDYSGSWSILPVVDTSWSMSTSSALVKPFHVAVSLWVYLAERIQWPFRNNIITFENKPHLVKINDSMDSHDKLMHISSTRSDMWTNIQWVFDLLLSVAVRDKLSQSDMPDKILIISDMEFNSCWSGTNFELIRNKFESAWYQLPFLIFWNVNGREWNNPAQKNDYVWLVSWASPSVIEWVLSWESLRPHDLMMKIIWSDRYKAIS